MNVNVKVNESVNRIYRGGAEDAEGLFVNVNPPANADKQPRGTRWIGGAGAGLRGPM